MSEKMKTSISELEGMWSFDDLMMAHEVLDVIEAAEAEAMKRD